MDPRRVSLNAQSGAVALLCTVLLAWAAGCAGPRSQNESKLASHRDVNQQLASVAARGPGLGVISDYRIGSGDVVEIDVFQADELDRTVRVRPDGTISFPLLGIFPAAGQTTAELEGTLTARLAEKYLNDPQISVFVKEYRAHAVSVLGEVKDPGVRYLRQPRTLVSMLSESGGLTAEAGRIIHLRRRHKGDEGESWTLVTIEIADLLVDTELDLDLLVQDGDTIFVPKRGVVFVEGAVRNPGVFPLQGADTVLKAVTLAGGLDFSAKQTSVQVARGGNELLTVDLNAIRNDPSLDIPVADGDIVIVGTDPVKAGLLGLWRGVTGLVRVSAGL